MRGRRFRTLLIAGAGALVAAAPASAVQINSFPAAAATSAIAAGPDGNLWVTQPFANSVVRFSPSGAVLNTYDVGGATGEIATAPDGKVWAAVPAQKKLVWFDAQAATPTAHDVSTVAASACGPAGVAPGPDARIYFSLPSDGACQAGLSRLGVVAADGNGPVVGTAAGGGTVYDLAVVAGKLWAPDFAGDAVRRLALGATPTVDATYPTPAGASPDGVTAGPDGKVWLTGWGNGSVYKLAPGTASGTELAGIPLTGGTLSDPFGIAAGPDGKVFVAGKASSNLVAIDPASGATTFHALPASEPMGLAKAPDGTLWIADESQTRVLQFVPDSLIPTPAPTPAPVVATPTPTPAPVVTPKVATKVTFSSTRRGATTTVTKVKVSGLVGGETITIRCSKGCGFTTKRFTKIKGRSATYDRKVFKGKRLASGAKVTVTVSKPGSISQVVTLTVRKGKSPTISPSK